MNKREKLIDRAVIALHNASHNAEWVMDEDNKMYFVIEVPSIWKPLIQMIAELHNYMHDNSFENFLSKLGEKDLEKYTQTVWFAEGTASKFNLILLGAEENTLTAEKIKPIETVVKELLENLK